MTNNRQRGPLTVLFRAKPQLRTGIATPLLMAMVLLASPLRAVAQDGFSWTENFLEHIAKVDASTSGELGIYLKDLDTGVSASYHGEEAWYLASTVKVPVAIAVMRRIDQDTLSLDSTVRLLESDYVDGAGPTKRHAPGTSLSVRYLMDQMLIHSDNTASDMLIRLVGLDAVNAVTRELVPEGLGPITTLAGVRRLIYGELHPSARLLSGRDFLSLKAQRSEAGRLSLLASLLGVQQSAFTKIPLREAYERYYATPFNSGTLQAYGDLLSAVVEGKALSQASTEYLLSVMNRVATGAQRIKAGLPPTVGYAHKTGTQLARICDAGVIAPPPFRIADPAGRIVVIACVRGAASTAKAERALRGAGEAITASGVLRL
ncbi:serine hydrolase [Pseudomonas sp. MTM4]|nr:serine hydrolase [Pseudomonas sp. MT4]QXY93771.1 serine hydrolase [Pseudomonas sp. MTM4]TCD23819.1 serine hydrolase [Pseudomonas sp. IC_126]